MATYTTNYNLPKYEASDLPNLLDEYNSAMDKIDAQMLVNANAANTAATAVANVQKTATDALELAQTNESAITTIESNVTSIESEQTSQASSISDHEQRITAVQGDVTELTSKVDQNTAGLATKAPIMHASAASTYGLGSAANFGHVKLSDEAGTDGASQGVAATPLAVDNAMPKLEILHTDTVSLAGTGSITAGSLTYIVMKYGDLIGVSAHSTGVTTSGGGSSTYEIADYTLPAELRPTADTGQSAYSSPTAWINIAFKQTGKIQIQYNMSQPVSANEFLGNAFMLSGVGAAMAGM